jgi:formate dehydrogenase subunit gamma
MATLLARLRYVVGALALALLVTLTGPVGAQQPINPTASSVNEQKLLQELGRIQGRISIPDDRAAVLVQPDGRTWRAFHQVALRWIGAIAILGMLAILVAYYLWRGMIRIEGGRTGRTMVRFNAFERFAHWLTAITFVILAISGLNITFGRPLLLPLLGPEAFTAWATWAKYAHNYLSFAFTIGILATFLMWVGNNTFDRVDLEWLKAGGGMIGKEHPPAHKFNAGQKILFWLVVLASIAVAVSGYLLMFPFYGTTILGMQLAQALHAVVALLFIALIIGHIYLGTIGMEGAFEAMGTGDVDLNWAKGHHSVWYEEEMARRAEPSHAQPVATAAE